MPEMRGGGDFLEEIRRRRDVKTFTVNAPSSSVYCLSGVAGQGVSWTVPGSPTLPSISKRVSSMRRTT